MKRKKASHYRISAVAEIYHIHPQTLRLYEKLGLLEPKRSPGKTRVYGNSDLDRLETILNLTRDLGVNLAGVEVILNMREKMLRMQGELDQLANHHRAGANTASGEAANVALVKLPSTSLVRGHKRRR